MEIIEIKKVIEKVLDDNKANDIVAWADSDKTSVYVEVNNDTHVLINGSEISYRADLYKNNQIK